MVNALTIAATIPTLSWTGELTRLAVAAGLGGLVGLEREFREREAGLRTHMLVAIGAALFTIVSAFGFHDVLSAESSRVAVLDPSRIAAQIVSGIGFLGAGAIIRQGLSIRGLTTAATLWAVAAIGMATGAGLYGAAVIATGLVLVMLWPMRYVGRLLDRPHTHHLAVTLVSGVGAGTVVEGLERLGARVESFELAEDEQTLELILHLPRGVDRTAIVRALMLRGDVRSASWHD